MDGVKTLKDYGMPQYGLGRGRSSRGGRVYMNPSQQFGRGNEYIDPQINSIPSLFRQEIGITLLPNPLARQKPGYVTAKKPQNNNDSRHIMTRGGFYEDEEMCRSTKETTIPTPNTAVEEEEEEDDCVVTLVVNPKDQKDNHPSQSPFEEEPTDFDFVPRPTLPVVPSAPRSQPQFRVPIAPPPRPLFREPQPRQMTNDYVERVMRRPNGGMAPPRHQRPVPYYERDDDCENFDDNPWNVPHRVPMRPQYDEYAEGQRYNRYEEDAEVDEYEFDSSSYDPPPGRYEDSRNDSEEFVERVYRNPIQPMDKDPYNSRHSVY